VYSYWSRKAQLTPIAQKDEDELHRRVNPINRVSDPPSGAKWTVNERLGTSFRLVLMGEEIGGWTSCINT
jgi:hypothetical protein